MRGTTINKKRFGFMPVPLYAFVKDALWIIQEDNDIDPESYESVYGKKIVGGE